MRIGIDASRLNINEKTGTEWYSYYLIKNLLNIDESNQYFLFSREKLDDEFLKYKNVKNIVLKWPFGKFWTLIRLSVELKKYKLDLFFSPSHNLPICKCKKIITWHDLGYLHYPEYYSKFQLFSLKLGAKQLKKADVIISPSEFTKNDIIENYKINKDKIFVVNHGLDFEKYNTILNKNILSFGVTKKYIIYIGRLEAKKNILKIIKSYNFFREKYNNNLELVLIGSRGYGYCDIQKEIENSKYKNDIKILGWVNEEDKIFLLQNASIYLNFSNFEGFGMPLLESSYCNIPMLIRDMKVFREFDFHDFCFVGDDIEIISDKINFILSNSDFRNEIIEHNYLVSKNYSWEGSARKIIDLFNRLK